MAEPSAAADAVADLVAAMLVVEHLPAGLAVAVVAASVDFGAPRCRCITLMVWGTCLRWNLLQVA